MTERIASRLVAALDSVAQDSGDRRTTRALELARRFGIDGYVARVCGRQASADRGIRLYRRLRDEIYREAAVEVHAALASVGVPHFFFKGIALMDRVYEPGDRDLQDIDLHVPPERREEVFTLVSELGYVEYPDRRQPGPESLRAAFGFSRATARTDIEAAHLDIHWAVEPLDRLLPRSNVHIPDVVWESVRNDASLPIPADEHHFVLLAHHIAHHDLLHVKGLLDLALVWERLSVDTGSAAMALARDLGAVRVTRLLSEWVRDVFDLPERSGFESVADRRGKLFLRRIQLDSVLRLAAAATDEQSEMITPQRIRKRVRLMDRRSGILNLLADALIPPKSYLEWRWPEAGSPFRAWWRHVGRLTRKIRIV